MGLLCSFLFRPPRSLPSFLHLSSSMSSPSLSPSSALIQPPHQLRLLDLPRDCIFRIISALDDKDACRLTLVCKTLKEAADADESWEQRLPKGYSHVIDGVFNFDSMKDLYFRLCSGVLLKNGTEAYWLIRGTSEGCFMKSARALVIVWVNDRRYWHWVPDLDSWFKEGAVLKRVCWFEVRGEHESIFQPGAYTVSFRIRLEHLYGWNTAPAKFSVSTSNGHHAESQRYLQGDQSSILERSLNVTPSRLLGKWTEYDAGEFFVEERDMVVKVQFTMIATGGGNWKGGIVLDGVKIQPSSVLREAPSNSA